MSFFARTLPKFGLFSWCGKALRLLAEEQVYTNRKQTTLQKTCQQPICSHTVKSCFKMLATNRCGTWATPEAILDWRRWGALEGRAQNTRQNYISGGAARCAASLPCAAGSTASLLDISPRSLALRHRTTNWQKLSIPAKVHTSLQFYGFRHPGVNLSSDIRSFRTRISRRDVQRWLAKRL